MRIALASDHAGFSLKERLRSKLEADGYDILDCGTFSDERADYPDWGRKAAAEVGKKRADLAIVVCGSGIGMCMVANKVRGVRAAVLRDAEDARFSREHNDANVACLGERVTDPAVALQLIELFLKTPFAGGRHESRVAKIEPQE